MVFMEPEITLFRASFAPALFGVQGPSPVWVGRGRPVTRRPAYAPQAPHGKGSAMGTAGMCARIAAPRADRAPVKAVVAAEPGVLARHRGADQMRGNLIKRAPALVDAVP